MGSSCVPSLIVPNPPSLWSYTHLLLCGSMLLYDEVWQCETVQHHPWLFLTCVAIEYCHGWHRVWQRGAVVHHPWGLVPTHLPCLLLFYNRVFQHKQHHFNLLPYCCSSFSCYSSPWFSQVPLALQLMYILESDPYNLLENEEDINVTTMDICHPNWTWRWNSCLVNSTNLTTQ